MIDEETLQIVTERAFAIGIQVGVINLSKELGVLDERVTERQAWDTHGKRQVNEWRSKRWIVGYPTGNQTIRKFYYKRSELETAQRMLDYQNIIPANRLKQIIEYEGTINQQTTKSHKNERSTTKKTSSKKLQGLKKLRVRN